MASFNGTIGTAPANTGSVAPDLPTFSPGDLVLIAEGGKYAASASGFGTPTGWTLVRTTSGGVVTTGNDAGDSFLRIYGRIMTGSTGAPGADDVPTFPSITANSRWFIAESWSPGSGQRWKRYLDLSQIPWVAANDTTAASPITGSGTFSTQPVAAQGANLTAWAAFPSDAGSAMTSPSATNGGLSGGTTTTRTYVENALGADSGGASWTRIGFTGTATGTTTLSVSITGLANNYGPLLALWLEEELAPVEKSGTDSAAGTDSSSTRYGAAGELAVATESAGVAVVLTRGVSDAAAATDTQARVLSMNRGASDSAPATDTVAAEVTAGNVNLSRSVADDAGATDSLARLLTLVRGPPDSAPATDTVVGVFSYSRPAADTAPATDAVTRSQSPQSRSVSDSAPAADTVVGDLSVLAKSDADSATAAESTSLTYTGAGELATATETADVDVISATEKTGADTATATDALTSRELQALDSAEVDDEFTEITDTSGGDNATATEAASVVVTVLAAPDDSAPATDTVTTTVQVSRTTADSAPAVDAAARQLSQTRTVLDGGAAVLVVYYDFTGTGDAPGGLGGSAAPYERLNSQLKKKVAGYGGTTADSHVPNHTVQITRAVVGTGEHYITASYDAAGEQPRWRFGSNGTGAYVLQWVDSNSLNEDVTMLQTVNGADGDILRLTVDPDGVRAYVNDVLIGQSSTTTIYGGTLVGIEGADVETRWDDMYVWEGDPSEGGFDTASRALTLVRAIADDAAATDTVTRTRYASLQPETVENDGLCWSPVNAATHVDAIADNDDSDYIKTDTFPCTTRYKLASYATPPAGTRMLRMRVGNNGSGTVTYTLNLYEGGGTTLGGGTLKGTASTTRSTAGLITVEATVTDAIGDYANLYVELVAVSP